MSQLGSLLGVFGLLSILAVGGGTAILPEMKHLTVTRLEWVTADQFVEIYSLGQMAPGPNMLMVSVIGYRVAGYLGALAALGGFFLPAGLLTLGASRLWVHFAGSPWREALQRGLAPVAIGLMGAGVVAIAKVATRDVATIALAAVVAAILLWRHVNPALLILAAGALGLLLFRG
jgi:chromate transporter